MQSATESIIGGKNRQYFYGFYWLNFITGYENRMLKIFSYFSNTGSTGLRVCEKTSRNENFLDDEHPVQYNNRGCVRL